MCERVNVMYAGMFVETGTADRIFARPRHPYTLGLLQSVPRARRRPPAAAAADPGLAAEHAQRAGRVPVRAPLPLRGGAVALEVPPLEELEPDHHVRCFNPVPADEWQRTRLGGAA